MYPACADHFREASGSSLWIISIDLMARQGARQMPTSSKNVRCGCQRSIDNSTFFIFFSNTKNNNDACVPHAGTISERPPEADCGLFPSIYWRARFRQVARREFRSRARVHSREGWCGVSPNTLKICFWRKGEYFSSPAERPALTFKTTTKKNY